MADVVRLRQQIDVTTDIAWSHVSEKLIINEGESTLYKYNAETRTEATAKKKRHKEKEKGTNDSRSLQDMKTVNEMNREDREKTEEGSVCEQR